MKKILSLLLIFVSVTSYATTPLWMRDVKISPDGKTIAFEYKGDIWTVPATGGTAKRLTVADNSYEDHPVWSPDSKNLAFSSDRYGSFDVFVVEASGGTPTRLTFNSANEIPEMFSSSGKEIYYSASIQDPSESALFPTARMTELYSIDINGGRPVQIAAVPVQMPSYSITDPDIIYYQDIKGFEDEWRKHHTSSVTRDIWKWNRKDNSFTNITNRAGEDRNPVISQDGQTLFFLRENPGESMNVYSVDISNPQSVAQITRFTNHPVRFLSQSNDGTLAFTYDGEIYTQKSGAEPQKVLVDILTDNTILPQKVRIDNYEDAVPSPDGKSVAFISRGDVFVTSTEYATTKQITNTPQAERQLSWNPDGKSLIYTSERDGHWNIYSSRKGRDSEPNFENATIIEESPLFPVDDNIERTYASYSPDGKKLAYIEDRNRLKVKDLATGKVTTLLDGDTHFSRGGGFGYNWSPDSKWIVAEAILHRHDPYSDILLVNAEDGTRIPLTETGYFDMSPRFVLDGNAVIFVTDRYGMRNHASWGSEEDIMIVFLNEEAFNRFTLSEEDYKQYEEIKKSNKEKSSDNKNDKEKKGKDEKKTAEDIQPIVVEPKNIQDRIVRLTPSSAAISDAFIDKEGENLYYLASFNQGYDLWKINLRKRKAEEVKKLDAGPSFFILTPDEKTVLLASSNSLKKLEPRDGKITPIEVNGRISIDHDAEREYMFDYVKRQEREMFYDTSMHGVDWENLTEHYRRFLPHINNNYDFAELLSELLGELNVSHTGGRYSAPANPNLDRTASLGVLIDMESPGPGLLVTEVLEGGAMDKSWSKLSAGDVIIEINGKTIDSDNNYDSLLADIAGKKTLVKFKKPSGEIIEEVMLPDNKGKESSLLYSRWVKQRAADVDKWSNGRLGYVHIASMGDASFRDIYADILGKYNEKEGIVVDIRWNGGGRLHEDIEVLFSGEKYFTQVVRGVEACDMPSRRWNKPSIMVQSEACYSNAHGTPWVYKHRGLGKLVGAPVPGTMTSVNWVRMQDPTMVFGIPVTGYRLPDGSYLENTQLEPDVYVLNAPADVVKGEDTQLHTAVITLLEDIDKNK